MVFDRHKLVPRDLGHCLENSIVKRAFADLAAKWFVFALIAATICRG
jgi:hypothetical protein